MFFFVIFRHERGDADLAGKQRFHDHREVNENRSARVHLSTVARLANEKNMMGIGRRMPIQNAKYRIHVGSVCAILLLKNRRNSF